MPELFIITGSNGAGKSSIGPDYLPTHIRQQGPIFDGDKLFVAVLEDGKPTNAVPSEMLPLWFQHYLPSITQKIRDAEPKFPQDHIGIQNNM